LQAVLRKLSLVLHRLPIFHKEYATIGDTWLRTYDIQGHRPTFPIICRHDKAKYILRYSQVLTKEHLTLGLRRALNVIEYKCPRCSLVIQFYVEDDPEYLNKILEMRGGVTLYLPPKDEWAKEHEEIKKRLEILRYM